MKTETKEKIIADYIREKNTKAGFALKAQKPADYYKKIGRKGGKAKAAKSRTKQGITTKLDSVAGIC